MIWLLIAMPYTPAERTQRLETIIEVVQRTPAATLAQAYQYDAGYERGACMSSNQRLRVECLITAARKYCAKQPNPADCAAYQDVIVSNVLAEQQLVPTARRFAIMQDVRDWRHEVEREIRRQQATLAASLRLHATGPLDTPAALTHAIDAFCAGGAFETGLSWQICASSLVWFIAARGTSE